ncbi:hypothetical protein [Leptospira kmetyi]|uniref:Uncharacterized protein n=1 Tax=Leptospira kmetyi TaxID=408139 RepID=A0ABX4NFG8_9LEPT|nr:hypothetical protein [Leptospira kmetyi]PJZ31283.1 hypothetical protein CH378_03545 [Leptospira kmetyi]
MKKRIEIKGAANSPTIKPEASQGRILIHPVLKDLYASDKTESDVEKRLKPEYISMIQSLLF